MNYQKVLKDLSGKYHRRASTINWRKIANLPPSLRRDYRKRIK